LSIIISKCVGELKGLKIFVFQHSDIVLLFWLWLVHLNAVWILDESTNKGLGLKGPVS